ncbi:MAG: hypothetical protein WC974_06885 [Thermoplasmata archaeon]
MDYVIFGIEKSKKKALDIILIDDLISRQSITIRDASAIDIKKDMQYVLIEGDEMAIKKAVELFEKENFKREPVKEAEKIYRKIKEQEDNAAAGVGFIFG